MAVLQLEQGQTLTDLTQIETHLEPLGIQLKHWPIGETLQPLLRQASLEDAQKVAVLNAFDAYFKDLQTAEGYQTQDLIVLHPDIPNLDDLLAKFSRPHTHVDNEVRYIVDGEGVFGFVCPDGRQMELTIQPEEYINVPAGTEHWFYLTPRRRIKAVRYFIDTSGWTPEYTQTQIRMQPVAV